MKALILAGGRGNRINEFSEAQNKCMIHLNNKPLIEYLLDEVAALDVTEIVVVVGFKAEDIINHFGILFKEKPIRYVIQREQRGLVHAIECATAALDGDDFFLMLGDEIMVDPKRKEMLAFFESNPALSGVCGILEVDDREQIKKTYALVKDENDRIFRLIEKPRRPINAFQGTGHCIFRHQILNYIDDTPIHHERGEKELPDLIQCCIDDGNQVSAFHICTRYFNINSKEDLKIVENLSSKHPF